MFKDLAEFEKKSAHLLAKTDEEAKARYEEYKSKDPFPRIQPALLNSVDIF